MNLVQLANPILFSKICTFCFIFLVQISSAAHYQHEACVPQACGNLSIKFPFYIRGLQESYCGHPEFELGCSNSAVIHLTEDVYVIDNIQYENRTFRVHNDAVSTVGGCLPQIGNISEDSQLGIVDTSRLHLLSNCSSKLPQVLSSYKVNYCDRLKAKNFGLVMLGEDKNLNIALQQCKTNVLAPVEVDRDGGNGIVDYQGLLRKGFLLNWKVGDCSKCEQSGGRCGFNESDGRMRCFCPDRPHFVRCFSSLNATKETGICAQFSLGRKRNSAVRITLGVLAPAMMIILVLLFGLKKRHSLRCWTEIKGNLENVETMLKNQGLLAPKRYSYSDLKKMTNSFKDKLGQGGFGAVYKGVLYDGSLVAVKILNERNGNEEDFINEVASVGRTSHVNIVTLLGFCIQGSKRALIYEFMPNGSLEKFIYAENSLTERQLGWQVLFQIAVGVARGLEYLHQSCNTRILHFDIKPHNILLDKDLRPKISDFGLAKLCPNRASIISMLGARGTAGYIAPEVFSRIFGEVSHKSDVYSYGMMILEMVGGRKNINLQVDHTSEIYFPHWIYNRLELNEEIGLQDIKNEDEHEKVRKMIIVGLWCIQIDPRRRPSIGRVVEMLEGRLHVDLLAQCHNCQFWLNNHNC